MGSMCEGVYRRQEGVGGGCEGMGECEGVGGCEGMGECEGVGEREGMGECGGDVRVCKRKEKQPYQEMSNG